MLKQQQSSLKRAQVRAKSIKVNVDSLLGSWQRAVDAITQAINDATQASQAGNADDAVNTLKDKVFDGFQDIGDFQQTFEMVANSQQMLKQGERELARVDKQVARLKRQGEDTANLEDLLVQARARVADIKSLIAQPTIDSEALIALVEDAQSMREEIYSALSDLTGQQFGQGQAQQQIPGLQFKPIEAPKGFGQLFQQGSDQGRMTKERCHVDELGADLPGSCAQVQPILNSRQAPLPAGTQTSPAPSPVTPSTSAVPGPQGLKNALDGLAPSLRASVVDAFRQYVARQLRKR